MEVDKGPSYLFNICSPTKKDNFVIAVGSNGSDILLHGNLWKILDKEDYNAVKGIASSGYNVVFWAVGANGRVAKYPVKVNVDF